MRKSNPIKDEWQSDDGRVRLLLGDCLKIPLPKFDYLISDPPYGINHPTDYKSRGRGALAKNKNFPAIEGDDKPFDPTRWISGKSVLWGANYFNHLLPPSSGWLVWDKRESKSGRQCSNDQADGELAWTNCVRGVRIFRHFWMGMLKESEKGESYHPHQKPVALFEWILSLIGEGIVYDPFMGSAPLGIACIRNNRPYVGVEIIPHYFEIAKQRIIDELSRRPDQPNYSKKNIRKKLWKP